MKVAMEREWNLVANESGLVGFGVCLRVCVGRWEKKERAWRRSECGARCRCQDAEPLTTKLDVAG